jgi:hypothetical protein
MPFNASSRPSLARRQDGIALLVTLMVLMLVSALMVGFVTAIVADQRASGLDRDQTQAYAAAHAGLEQLTSDLSGLFTQDFSPDAARISTLTATPPALTGFQFIDPDGSSGYRIIFTPDGSGNPAPENPAGSTISAGPYQGFRGIITPYNITVTARSRGGAEVRMRRTLQTVAVPVFQFGLFSENDLSFFAGPDFNFGGRVHTNANLFLASGNGTTLTLADRITAVGEVIRTNLSNGWDTNTNYTGTVRVIRAAPATFRNLTRTEGSLVTNNPAVLNEPNWTTLSVGTYSSNIRNGRTGARRLDLPLVSQGARPIDLIRRPAVNSNENVGAARLVYDQRFFGQAAVRILLSDSAAEIQQLPTVTQGTQPVALFGPGTVLNYAPGASPTRAPLGSYDTPGVLAGPAGGQLHGSVYKGNHDEPVLGGFIKIEIQRQGTTPTNGVWQDVTGEVLALGIAGRNLADSTEATIANRWNKVPDNAAETCSLEPNPNAIIRLQRIRDIPINNGACGVTVAGGVVTAVSQNEHDYWPNTLYDAREAQTRDATAAASTDLALAGVMHYVELDVNNLRRWLAGQLAGIGAPNGANAKNDNGYIVYFSDRRGNKNQAGVPVETGEFGYEDTVNPGTAAGAPNGGLPETGEDANGDAALDLYGRIARNVPAFPLLTPTGSPCVAGYPNPLHAATLVTQVLTNPSLGVLATVGANCAGAGQVALATPAVVKPLVARANRPLFFRRALKIVNGGLGNLPNGLTIASENPTYVQGDYNAQANNTLADPHVPAAIIADAVTLLSNNWNDLRSFSNPANPANRPATTTGYRVAIVGGKSLQFPRPTAWASAQDFGTDGGAHNFLRLLEGWNNGSTLNYRGSIVSFFTSRQAVGSYKCCTNVYAAPNRGFNFDNDFLTPSLLPPGTPMFRDVNTLTFRQLLRPTQ